MDLGAPPAAAFLAVCDVASAADPAGTVDRTASFQGPKNLPVLCANVAFGGEPSRLRMSER